MPCSRVETRSVIWVYLVTFCPGQLGLTYHKISVSDLDFAMDYVRMLIMSSGPDQSNELSMHTNDDGSVSL